MEIDLTLKYTGSTSDNGMIDFYDASQALVGFERVISLTTHLVINDEVIVQSPSLRGAQILSNPPVSGSWSNRITVILASGIISAGMATRDSAVGHLMISAYDYVISESLGFNVDFDSTLGQQFEQLRQQGKIKEKLDQSRFDSVKEKCDSGLKSMHRPFVGNRSATDGRVYWSYGSQNGGLNSTMNFDSYEYLTTNFRSKTVEEFCGIISSYNSNTFRGRIYVPRFDRNLAFELSNSLQDRSTSSLIAENMASNIRTRGDRSTLICFNGLKNESRSGALKSLYFTELDDPVKDLL